MRCRVSRSGRRASLRPRDLSRNIPRGIDEHAAGERPDFRLAAAVLGPRLGGDGGLNQIDQRIEIGVGRGAAAYDCRCCRCCRVCIRPEQESVLRPPGRATARRFGSSARFAAGALVR